MASFLSTLFGGGAEAEAADKNRALYNSYQGQGTGYLQTGYNTGQTNLNQALGAFSPLTDLAKKYGTGTDLYLGALGAGGPQGTAAAQAAFTNAPGYSGAIDAGLDTINRRRASMGMAASGNADIDAQTFGQNLQNQQYNTWLGNLGGLVSPELQATSGAATGQAATYGSLADLGTKYAENQVGLLGGTTSGLASANNLQAQGEASGARNALGAGLSLATLALGGAGGGLLGGVLGSSGLGGAVSGAASSGLGSLLGQNWQQNNPGIFGSSYYGPAR